VHLPLSLEFEDASKAKSGYVSWPVVAALSRGAVCVSCNATKAQYSCARCGRQTYCSQQCQKDDWVRHKPLCGNDGKSMLVQGTPLEFVQFLSGRDVTGDTFCSEPLQSQVSQGLHVL
jgi:MYND finger